MASDFMSISDLYLKYVFFYNNFSSCSDKTEMLVWPLRFSVRIKPHRSHLWIASTVKEEVKRLNICF